MKKHIRFDWAIKRLLRQKANFGILEGFLCELFWVVTLLSVAIYLLDAYISVYEIVTTERRE